MRKPKERTCWVCGDRPPTVGLAGRSVAIPAVNDVLNVLVEIRDLLKLATVRSPESTPDPMSWGGRLKDQVRQVVQVQSERSPVLRDPGASCNIHAAMTQYLALKQHEVSPQHLDIMKLTLAAFIRRSEVDTVGVVDVEDVSCYRASLLADGITVKTVNNHMAILSAFFAWTVAGSLRMDNPAVGLKLKDRTKASRARKAFTAEQITEVFRTLAEPPLHLRVPGINSAKRWIPLIMLYTGARPEEVAQLRVGDVRLSGQRQPAAFQDGQIIGTSDQGWVFDFTTMDDGQRRKNEASRRLVPVHPRLWELGLQSLLHADSLQARYSEAYGGRACNLRLFPELSPGANGRLAEAPSRWFNQTWLRQVKGISDRKLVLYSLRHSVATHLKHKGIEESLIAELLGHANSSMTTGRYGKDYPVQALAKAVAELDWKV